MQTPISTLVQSYSKTSTAYKAWGKEEYKLTVEGLDGYPLSRFALAIRQRAVVDCGLSVPPKIALNKSCATIVARPGDKIVYCRQLAVGS